MEKLLELLREKGGKIVSTSLLSEYEIAKSKAENTIFIDEQGFGFVWIPANTEIVNGVCLKIHSLMNNADFLKWWKVQSDIIEENMIQFDIEQRINAAKAFEELSKIIIRL